MSNRALLNPNRKLTKKQEAFVKFILDNPKASAGEAARHAYNTSNDNVSRVVASENLTKPNIKLELAKHSRTAENTLLKVMDYSSNYGSEGGREGASYAAVAISAARDILDRVHGKATQRIEQQSTSVNLNLNLSDVIEDDVTTN